MILNSNGQQYVNGTFFKKTDAGLSEVGTFREVCDDLTTETLKGILAAGREFVIENPNVDCDYVIVFDLVFSKDLFLDCIGFIDIIKANQPGSTLCNSANLALSEILSGMLMYAADIHESEGDGVIITAS